MALPSLISTVALWPDNRNSVVGPFESNNALYVFLVDKPNQKFRCFRSVDSGHAWAEQDAANAPATTSVAFGKSAHWTQSGSTIYGFCYLNVGGIEVRPFDCSTNTWQTAISGPSMTLNSYAFYGDFRSDGSIVLFYRGTSESVMGNNYERIKVQYRTSGGVWNGPYDVVGSANSPVANTLPGTQVSYTPIGFIMANDRAVLFYGSPTTSTISCRVFNNNNTFATALTLPGVTVTGPVLTSPVDYPMGMPCLYTDGGTLKVAVPFRDSAALSVKVARCIASGVETSGNWSVDTTGLPNVAYQGATPAVLYPDATNGKKLWMWLCLDNERSLLYSDDAGAGTWRAATTWKSGDEVRVAGFSTRYITGAIGVAYDDDLGEPYLSQPVQDTDLRVGYSDTGNENRVWQKFRVGGSGVTLTKVRFRIHRVGTGSTSSLIADVVTDSGNSPTTTTVGTASASQVGTKFSTTSGWYTFTVSSSLSANTDYWVRLRPGGNSTSDYFVVKANSASVYADGSLATGTSANVATVDGTKDLAFQLHTSQNSVEGVYYDRALVFAPK